MGFQCLSFSVKASADDALMLLLRHILSGDCFLPASTPSSSRYGCRDFTAGFADTAAYHIFERIWAYDCYCEQDALVLCRALYLMSIVMEFYVGKRRQAALAFIHPVVSIFVRTVQHLDAF